MNLLRWCVLSALVAVMAGSASAALLWALDAAAQQRMQHPWLIWGLPGVGLLTGWCYLKWGEAVSAGNNLLIRAVRDPAQPVAWRMAPLIFGSTLAAHVFGASVGREGTAVQVATALAAPLTQPFRLDAAQRRLLLWCGMAAGFAGVFGTPWAGTIFALEVVAMGWWSGLGGPRGWWACWPVLLSAWGAHAVALAWGAQHAHHAVTDWPEVSWRLLVGLGLAGVAFGLMGRWFAQANRAVAQFMASRWQWAPWRPLVGGLALLVVHQVATWQPQFGLDPARYAGLGTGLIDEAFVHAMPAQDFALKALFTSWSIGTGFKGGEVTPLFAMGASLGNALSGWTFTWLHLPLSFMAALGWVAVFAAAARTPLACTVMAIELFGWALAPHAAVVCGLAHWVARRSGHPGIYAAQAEPWSPSAR